jgi:hypothetical protein
MEKLLYTVDEARQLIPISTTALYKAVAQGDIASHKLNRRRVFTAQALINYVLQETGQKPQKRFGVTHGK